MVSSTWSRAGSLDQVGGNPVNSFTESLDSIRPKAGNRVKTLVLWAEDTVAANGHKWRAKVKIGCVEKAMKRCRSFLRYEGGIQRAAKQNDDRFSGAAKKGKL